MKLLICSLFLQVQPVNDSPLMTMEMVGHVVSRLTSRVSEPINLPLARIISY
jgi:hypothetical protein